MRKFIFLMLVSGFVFGCEDSSSNRRERAPSRQDSGDFREGMGTSVDDSGEVTTRPGGNALIPKR